MAKRSRDTSILNFRDKRLERSGLDTGPSDGGNDVISPEGIQEKALRLYPKFVKAWLTEQDFFPRRVPVNLALPNDLAAAKRCVEQLRYHSKQSRGFGYSLTWQSRRSRSHGLNEFPCAVSFDCESDFLQTIDHIDTFSSLKTAVAKLRKQHPRLNDWLLESTHWKELLNVSDRLDDLLLMTQHFIDNPRPNCFAREISLPVSTKLIEANRKLLAAWLDRLLPEKEIDFRFDREEFEPRYGLRYVRHHLLIRCLDSKLQEQLGLKFPELSLPSESINKLSAQGGTVFIVENKVNLLTLPPVRNSIAIGGLGTAISLLRDVHWLQEVPIYYWGDLDVEGFEMLSQFRGMFEHTQSFLMDLSTLRRHSDLVIEWPNRPNTTPTTLTESEHTTYDHLLTHRIRLEQERISQSDVHEQLHHLGLISQSHR